MDDFTGQKGVRYQVSFRFLFVFDRLKRGGGGGVYIVSDSFIWICTSAALPFLFGSVSLICKGTVQLFDYKRFLSPLFCYVYKSLAVCKNLSSYQSTRCIDSFIIRAPLMQREREIAPCCCLFESGRLKKKNNSPLCYYCDFDFAITKRGRVSLL